MCDIGKRTMKPSCAKPLFQREAKRESIDMKMIFLFPCKLKKRKGRKKVRGFGTRKWPIIFLFKLGSWQESDGLLQEYDYFCRSIFVFVSPVQFLPSPVKPTLQEQK